jgi:hypothetical protein
VWAWLRDNGYAVKDRGRVPMDLIAAYENRPAATAATDHPAASNSRKRREVNNVEFSGGNPSKHSSPLPPAMLALTRAHSGFVVARNLAFELRFPRGTDTRRSTSCSSG